MMKTVHSSMALTAILLVVAASLPSCALFRGEKGGVEAEEANPGGAVETVSASVQEEQLRGAVERHVGRSEKIDSLAEAPLVKHDPYFLKEFSEYPTGLEDLDVQYRETESRMAPRVADVTLSKVRYATDMHRKKDRAREDGDFYRETGTETLSYQWRNGRWVQVASMFIVEKKEEQVNGEWRRVEPVVEEEEVFMEQDEGFFRRLFGGIFGR
jgi:hypothetical protein